MMDMHRRRNDSQTDPVADADLKQQIAALTQTIQDLEATVVERYERISSSHHIVLRDVDMAFGSMILLAIKWILAYVVASIIVLGLPLLIILVFSLSDIGLRLGR